jgi:hypothetical protein
MTKQRPIQIDRQPNADQETEQAILRVQRTLCLMNAPHSYRLFDAATLMRQAARVSEAIRDEGIAETGLERETAASDKAGVKPRDLG